MHSDINKNNIMFTPAEAPERAVIIAVVREDISEDVWRILHCRKNFGIKQKLTDVPYSG